MISALDRENAVLLINEAIKSGASCKKACERLGITERTFYRWKKRKADTDSYEDGRPRADHSNPANKIPAEIRREIINICNRPEYASMAPCEIVPALADEGIYIASESTFYRVLREEKMLNHRGRSEAPKHNRPSTYSATVPNQVYMWDITYGYVLLSVPLLRSLRSEYRWLGSLRRRKRRLCQQFDQKDLFKTRSAYYRAISLTL